MKHVVALKVVVACYACYMMGGFLSAFFMQTSNRIGAVIAIAVPTVVTMICVATFTQRVQPAKKKLPKRLVSRVARPRKVSTKG